MHAMAAWDELGTHGTWVEWFDDSGRRHIKVTWETLDLFQANKLWDAGMQGAGKTWEIARDQQGDDDAE